MRLILLLACRTFSGATNGLGGITGILCCLKDMNFALPKVAAIFGAKRLCSAVAFRCRHVALLQQLDLDDNRIDGRRGPGSARSDHGRVHGEGGVKTK